MAVVGFGFVIAKVSDVVPPSGMLGAPNALVRDGGPITVSVAVLLVAPGPDWVELIAPVVLLSTPAVLVTFTVIVHDPFAASDAPLRLTVVALAGAEKVPPQWFVADGGLATFSPEGNGSENAMPLRLWVALGLVMVKVRVELPPWLMVAGEKALLIVGGVPTVNVAVLLVVPVLSQTYPTSVIFGPRGSKR
jgi:hypothetical protein